MKQYRLMEFMALGVTAVGFNLLLQPVYGATLTSMTLEAAEDWTPHPWQIYLRGGGITSWEATVRLNPEIRNSQPGDPQSELRWPAWVGLPWELEIVGTELIFGIEKQQVEVTQIDGQNLIPNDLNFDGLKLWASATTLEGRVSAGTETFITVEEVNRMTVPNSNDVSCSAIASTLGVEQGCQTAYASDESIFQLKGLAGMLWKDGLDPYQSNPQSHLQIFIEAFDRGPDTNITNTNSVAESITSPGEVNSNTNEDLVVSTGSSFSPVPLLMVTPGSDQIPEPSTILGLLGVGTLGLSLKGKKKA